MKIKKFLKILLVLIFALINIILIPSKGISDIQDWREIISIVQQNPSTSLVHNYLNYNLYPLTYPPGHLLLVYFVAKIFPVYFLSSHLIIKLAIFFFYLFIYFALCYFKAAVIRQKLNIFDHQSAFLYFVVIFSLGYSAQGLGFTDVFFLPFLIFSISHLYSDRYLFAGFFYSLAFLIKWQPLILFPLFLVYFLKMKNNYILKKFLLFLAGLCIPVFGLYWLNPNVIHTMINSIFYGALSDPIFTAALNLPWLAGSFIINIFPGLFELVDSGLYQYIIIDNTHPFSIVQMIPKIISILMILIFNFLFYKSKGNSIKNFLHTATITVATYFFISSGVHENHLITGLITASLLYLYSEDKKDFKAVILINFIVFSNIFIFYTPQGDPFPVRFITGIDISLIFTFISLVYYLLLVNYFIFNMRNH